MIAAGQSRRAAFVSPDGAWRSASAALLTGLSPVETAAGGRVVDVICTIAGGQCSRPAGRAARDRQLIDH